MSGVIWVVATPIGNLEDITLRALRILREAEWILAEDTRHTGTLLRHHEIQNQLRSLHAHTSDAKIEAWVERVAEGARVALVSDAGTPIVSDPGARLIARAKDRGLRVEPIPGPSAVLAALSASGLRAERFRFVGFLPRRGRKRSEALDAVANDSAAQVLFEAPKRLPALLDDLATHLGERRLAVCRELTKLHEEIVRGTATELKAHFPEPRGEVTLVVEAVDAKPAEIDIDAEIRRGLEAGERPGTLAKAIARATKHAKSEIYARIVALQAGGSGEEE
ncbi:MAG: 16S rRNA (cytidine(1402)-2'-O)-methyltransferase [Myxococcota bacterium]